jgi:hypothetical protein
MYSTCLHTVCNRGGGVYRGPQTDKHLPSSTFTVVWCLYRYLVHGYKTNTRAACDSCFVTHLTVENLLEVAGCPLVNRHLDDFLLFDCSLPLAGLAAARSRDRLTPPLTVTAHALHTGPLSHRLSKILSLTLALYSLREPGIMVLS